MSGGGRPLVIDTLRETVGFEIAVFAVFVALLLIVAVGYLLRRLRRPPARHFVGVLHEHDDVDVLLHPNPDPDAMAAGLAVQAIAEAAEVDSRLVYPGRLRHHENRAFRTVLSVDMERLDGVDDFGDRPVVLVDHGSPRGFEGAEAVDPLAVIDHHDDEPVEAPHVDVRPEYGACSTILHEYLRDLGADVDGEDDDLVLTSELASALIYGIHTDTNHLTRGVTKRDFDAAIDLYDIADPSALDRISNPPIEAEVLDAKASAITNREVRDCYCVSDLGSVGSADSIATTADELLQLEGVTTAIAVGDHNGTLYLSGRSIDDRVHIGDALQRTLEVVPHASAGGHARMGGGQIAIEDLDGIGPNTGLSRENLPNVLFATLREAE